MAILKVTHFKKAFGGVKAVDDLSFEIEAGKITGLIGPNGSGKSTMINLLTGVISKDSGVLIISDDVTIQKIRPHDMYEYRMTRTFQNVRLFEQMSVLDNILVVLTKRNIWSALFETKTELYDDRAHDILKSVDLYDKRNEQAGNLSYGQRKLLEIGRAIAMNADVVLFDEPYAGLFPEMVKKVSKIITEMKAQGKAVVLIEHNMEIIRELCDYVVIMDAGKLLAMGEPEDVLSRNDVIKAYLGE